MKKSRSELFTELTSLVQQFDMADIKMSLVKRYRVDEFKKLDTEQLFDFLKFLKNAGKALAIILIAFYIQACGKAPAGSCGTHAESIPSYSSSQNDCFVLKDCNGNVVGGNCNASTQANQSP
jgi:hypothetical protein